MKNFGLLLIFASNFCVAALVSPFPSSVDGLDIPNSHVLEEGPFGSPLLVRGNAPRGPKDIKQLHDIGIKNILIFKDQKTDEIDREILELGAYYDKEDDITHIPFPWKDIPNFKGGCQQIVAALKLLVNATRINQPLFFHCTVGEDRTGLLAGLYRQAVHERGFKSVFFEEMCENGYGSGDPQKPFSSVVVPIRKGLTPLYLKMSYLINRYKTIDKIICDRDPAKYSIYKKYWAKNLKNMTCKPSSKFPRD